MLFRHYAHRKITLAEYLNAVLRSTNNTAVATAAAASTDKAMKALLHDLKELSEKEQMDLQLQDMRASTIKVDAAAPPGAAHVLDHEKLAAKLLILFAKADVKGGTADMIGNSDLTEDELQYHLDRKQMKSLLEEAGQLDLVDSNGDGKLSLDEILYHIDTDDSGSISLQEYLNAVLKFTNNNKDRSSADADFPEVNDMDAILNDANGGEVVGAAAAQSVFGTDNDAMENLLADVQMSIIETKEEEKPATIEDVDRRILAAKLGVLFQKADATLNDGDLSKEELQYHLNRKEMMKLLEEAGNLERFDGNADGKLSINEILASMDVDDNGSVSLEEFLAAVLGTGDGSNAPVSKFSEHWV